MKALNALALAAVLAPVALATQGTGGWTYAPGDAAGIALADVNGDAYPDPVVYHYYDPGSLRVPSPGTGIGPVDTLGGRLGTVNNGLSSAGLLLGASRGGALALDGLTGQLLWSTDLPGWPLGIQAADLDADGTGEVLVVTHTSPLERGVLLSLDAATGRVEGSVQRFEGYAKAFAVADFNQDRFQDVALAVQSHSSLDMGLEDDAVEVVDGRALLAPTPLPLPQQTAPPLLWRTPLTCPLTYTCSVFHWEGIQVGDMTGDGVPDVATLNDFGRLDAFDGRDGHHLWVQRTGAFEYNTGIAVHGGVVYAASEAGFLAVDGAANATLWRDARAYGTMARVADVDGQLLVFTGNRSHAIALDAATGSVAWEFAPGVGRQLTYGPHDIRVGDVHPHPGLEVVVSMSEGPHQGYTWTDPAVVLVLSAATGALLEEIPTERNALRLALTARDSGPGSELFVPIRESRLLALDLG